MPVQQARQIVLASRPNGMPSKENFRTVTVDLPDLQNGQVLLEAQYLSVDPYMRGRMSEGKSYVPPYQIHGVMGGATVAKVLSSKAETLQPGDFVIGDLGWVTHAVTDAARVRKVDPAIAPVSTSLGVLGMTGLTAYFGLIDICHPQAGETVVVSGAAGAVGTTVGQIAKILGCKVVGIAGSDVKTTYLTEQLGFDTAVNYKTTPDINQAVKDACPDGVDVYFDNVGGAISDAVMWNLNDHARISVCGQIALYNLSKPDVGPRIQTAILIHRALMKGFIVSDYSARFKEGIEQLATWYQNGQLKYEESIVDGFDNTVDAFLGLFRGENLGKQIVRLDA